MGTLSSLVLFIASFPDHDADKSKGRKDFGYSSWKTKGCKTFLDFSNNLISCNYNWCICKSIPFIISDYTIWYPINDKIWIRIEEKL